MRIKKIDHLIDPIIDDEDILAQIGFIHRTAAEQPSDVLEIETRLVEAISTLLSGYSTISLSVRERCREHRAVNEVKEFMLAHYADRITLQGLADLVDLDISYLVRVFRNHVGLPPYTYLTEIRLARARNLLSSGMAPAVVAAAVGLADQSHLTRMFRRRWGVTPGYFARSRSLTR